MVYKIRDKDKDYKRLVEGIPKDVTYRHLSNGLFLLSIPLIGNLVSLILAIQFRINKGWEGI